MNASKYIAKQDRLNAAIKRTETQLNRFKNGLREDLDNWDNFHDLKYRLEDRLRDNLSEYKGKFFEVHGWVAL